MKIEEVRPSFTVYVIASDASRTQGIAESLGKAGYMVARFTELTSAFSEFFSNPPHFVLFDFLEQGFDLSKAIDQVVNQLPESHVFIATPVTERQNAAAFFEQGIYDLLLTPVLSNAELLKALDRAAERDYFMYLNEQLMQNPNQESATESNTQEVSFGEDIHLEFVTKLFAQTSHDDCLAIFMKLVSQALGGVPLVYFKYINNRRVLVASVAEQIDTVDLKDLGLNLNEAVPGFRTVMLRDPIVIEPFAQMIREVFSAPEFLAWPVEALGELQGVMCVLTQMPSPYMNQIFNEWLVLLGKALNFVEAEKRLHVVSTKDFHTDLLNRQTFISKLSEEISRARRTQLPITLISIVVDQYGQLSSAFGQDEAQLVMRTTARILEKHSRVNDIIGRTGVDEFGILLPHTELRGGLIKAERLRKLLESADFSKVLEKFPHLTISLGVSEYPTIVRDAEELKSSADEALYQVRQEGNKTCAAKPVDGFEPDFKLIPSKAF